MKRILLLDRRAESQEWFRGRFLGDRLDWTSEPDTAIEWLRTQPAYDFFFVAQDLGHEPARPGQVGRKATLWLCEHRDAQKGLRTIIHTENPVSGPKMQAELRAVGRPAKWLPWYKLKDAFDVVLEMVEDTGGLVA